MTDRPEEETKSRVPLRRRSDRRILGGLAAGIGDAIGVDASYVRAGFIVLSLAGGAGIVLYGVGWLFTIDASTSEPGPNLFTSSESEVRRAIGFQLAVIGLLVYAATIDLTLHPSIVWPTTLMVMGVANVWAHGDNQSKAWLAAILPGADRPAGASRTDTLVRLGVGGLFVAGGVTLAITTTDTFSGAGIVVVSVAITLIGLLVVLGPWMWRLWAQLTVERRQRIRSEEKTELAAHLHDSVLQTLALIQSSSDPEQQAVLARIQERELRQWLFTDTQEAPVNLKAMMDAMAAEVEKTHKIVVEAVTVGDSPVDDDIAALVRATREAMLNAAKHSGRRSVSLFTEVGTDRIEVFVTDQGIGFDVGDVGEDRVGIAESIRGRMQRHGGTATITSTPGDGTEVHLTMPARSEP